MTLRCRGCKYAFRVEDGLTQDPEQRVVLGAADVVSPADDPVQNGSAVTPSPISPSSPTVKKTKPAIEKAPTPIDLEDDFDDVLDVLESPVSETLAPPPPRAHVKRQQNVAATA